MTKGCLAGVDNLHEIGLACSPRGRSGETAEDTMRLIFLLPQSQRCRISYRRVEMHASSKDNVLPCYVREQNVCVRTCVCMYARMCAHMPSRRECSAVSRSDIMALKKQARFCLVGISFPFLPPQSF